MVESNGDIVGPTITRVTFEEYDCIDIGVAAVDFTGDVSAMNIDSIFSCRVSYRY